MLLKSFWVVARRQVLVYNQRFGNTCLSHLQSLRSYLRPWRWDKQVFPKRWLYTKTWRRAKTQKLLSKDLFVILLVCIRLGFVASKDRIMGG
jgi:hypothetical protein